MPTNRRHRGQKRRAARFGEDQLDTLLSGRNYFGYRNLQDKKAERLAMQTDWQEYGDEILSNFIAPAYCAAADFVA